MALLDPRDFNLDSKVWNPRSAAQLTATLSLAEVLLFGGKAGSLKTGLLVGDAVREKDCKDLRALFLRESYPKLTEILDQQRELYTQMGAYYTDKKGWRFPSGAKVELGYLDEKNDFQGIPHTAIYIDESTKQPMTRIRRLLPWLRTTNENLFLRMRLATNPGGISAEDHKQIFLRGHCPVHSPELSAEPGKLYHDAVWPSDKKLIEKSVAFIPGTRGDHSLLGADYEANLRTQEAALADKLLSGCWCRLEGRYFSFLNKGFVRPYAEIGEQWWWNHLISVDYLTCPAAGLYAISEPSAAYPEGQMFKIGEISHPRTADGELIGSREFAEEVCEAFVRKSLDGRPRRFLGWYCDPANDAQMGTGKSNMQLMAEVFERYGLSVTKSFKSRIANAQNLYHYLKYGQVVLTDAVPITYAALNSRLHDPKNPGDILKVKGDPLDDVNDETQYCANTFFTAAVKPSDVAHIEHIQELREQGASEFSVNMEMMRQLQRQMNEEREDEEPIYLGRSRQAWRHKVSLR